MDDERLMTVDGGIDWRQLPEFAPGPGLWQRIEVAQRRQVRGRRWRLGGLAAAAAMIAGVAVLLQHPATQPLQQDTLAGQRESQTLENEWQQLAGGAARGGTTHLRVIDAALQAAYDRGAAPDELAPLWQERNQALRGLIERFQHSTSHDVLAVTRI
jgi:hypothetical protein